MIGLTHIWIDWLRINIYWAICNKQKYEELIFKEFKIKINTEHEIDGRFRVFIKGKTPIGVIWICKKSQKTIAHECFHAAYWMLGERGIRPSDETEEVFAYMIEYLVEKITEKQK